MSGHADYFSIKAVNASSLKAMAKSPLHYHYGLTHDRPDTPAMAKGRAVHCAVLEPLQLPLRYTAWDGARRGKDWEQFKQVNAGKDILTVAEWEEVAAIAASVRRHPIAKRLLASGRAEQTVVWRDEKTKLRCKARLDWVRPRLHIAVDIKTSRDISDHAFSRTTHDLLYHIQFAHYLAGLEAVTGRDWTFQVIAVESSPPFDVRVGPATEDALYAGEQERRRLLELVASCTASGRWPGAFTKEDSFDLPLWYYAAADRVLEGLA